MKRMLFVLVIILSLTFCGCIQKQQDPKIEKRDFLSYSIEKLPQDLTSLEEISSREEDIICALFDGLVELDDRNEIRPALAKDYEVTSDGLGYTFTLREDIFWSDGKEIEARDFVDFFRYILNPKSNNSYAMELYSIYGAEEYNKGNKSPNDMAINTINKKTLQIRLNYANPDFLKTLTKSRYRLRKDYANLKAYNKNYKNIVFTGPYKIEIFSENEIKSLKLVKNEKYYDYNNVLSDNVVINEIYSSELAMANFDTGKIDLFFNPPISEYGRLSEKKFLNFIPLSDFTAISFNFKSPKASVINFRKFMEQIVLASLDESELLKEMNLSITKGSLLRKEEEVKATFSLDKEKEYALTYDFFKANSMIKGILKEEGDSVKIIALNNEKNKILLSKMKEILNREFNVDLKAALYNQLEFEEAMKKADYDIVLKDYKTQGNNAMFFKLWYNSEGKELSYFSTEYEDNISKLKLEKDKNKINQYTGNIYDIIRKDLVIMPVYFNNLFICSNKNISGLLMDGNENIVIKSINKEGIDKKLSTKEDIINQGVFKTP